MVLIQTRKNNPQEECFFIVLGKICMGHICIIGASQ